MRLYVAIREVFDRAGPAAALMLWTIVALLAATFVGYG